jgi:hypothetical protein
MDFLLLTMNVTNRGASTFQLLVQVHRTLEILLDLCGIIVLTCSKVHLRRREELRRVVSVQSISAVLHLSPASVV